MQNISFHSISESRIPIAITDLNLTLQYGNKSLYTLIGNDLFYSIYKVVLPSDRTRLSECIHNISITKSVTDIFSILYSDNEYHHMLLNFTYIKNNKLIKIEFQYLSDIINEHSKLEFDLIKYRTLFTLVGDKIFEYQPETNHFKFYWINEKQNILLFNGDLTIWKDDMMKQERIAREDLSVFLEFCQSLVESMKNFEYQISCSILSNGEIFETTKLKGITLKDHNDKKIVIGVCLPFNTIHNTKENHFIDNLYKDELTGLLNKREIKSYAQNLLRQQPDHNIYLFIMDLDNFKQCNDMFGHMFGDEILKAVSTILKNTIQQHGVAGRIGGDEFLVILEDVDSEKLLRNMLRSIRANIQWLYKEKLAAFQLGCSMGVACYPKDASDYDTLFKLADYSLYLAKNKGKSRYIIYDSKLHGLVNCNGNDNSILTQNIPFQTTVTLLDVQKKIFLLYTKGKPVIPEIFQVIKEFYKLHNIVIYIPNLSYADVDSLNSNTLVYMPMMFYEDYLSQFIETSTYCVTNIKNIEFTYSKIYHYFSNLSSTSYFQCLMIEPSNHQINGIISYEHSSVHYSWSNDTRQLLALISSMVNAILFT
ncbi:GGDEF domain-containing protein [Candidatus Galacturonibacter soehngenii]|uniref:GGDEF domain-containing protein n=1 Tax=Candidatus Galacturonatibacter soehngenii TaxID=2307010 RepID=A0A7V7QLD2_9FIRM|nr:GGDEF domain-containing protein [Candidatus Galacturonibacter soehngenii]KAB1438621.1 GGDEF domain-containing protein [Candidatus Galacturonibacter soehngenii]MBA4685648.1 GGDEF domain-containing protein [Candidatus Galacturonibacter soehngenii]